MIWPRRTVPPAEWLEADGLGGFASGPVRGPRTRRYHAVLLAAQRPPTDRVVLVNGFDAWVETAQGRYDITTQRYAPDVTHPDVGRRLIGFSPEPWPRWTFRLENGIDLTQELVVPRGAPVVLLRWTARGRRGGARLHVRPYLSGRDPHTLHKRTDRWKFDATVQGERIEWLPYPHLPAVLSIASASYTHDPDWYLNFQYDDERARGLDFTEDLGSPGVLTFDLAHGEASWILCARSVDTDRLIGETGTATSIANRILSAERKRRTAFHTPLHRAADQYVVRRGTGTSVIAGYPWFTDWGRDTFIAMRGLCIATGRLEEARSVLLSWADLASEGMLPNHFPGAGAQPQYNSVDASLWYIVAVHDFLQACDRQRQPLATTERNTLEALVRTILRHYREGTRFGIHADADGLLAAGEPGTQVTWMDAMVDGRPCTPRIGKPVEVQALWINALRIGSALDDGWEAVHRQALASFRERFWNADRDCLYDIVDVDHDRGRNDPTVRPNQILAIGGLPYPVLSGAGARRRSRAVVDTVEERLWTPLGLRTLAPDEPGYAGRYEGGVAERDGAYHQGTAWPWLLGPFVEAWLAVRGGGPDARTEARDRFLTPLVHHLEDAGVAHLSEIADGDLPQSPRGCPFQAWSLGELLRVLNGPLALGRAAARRPPGARR